MFYIGWTKDIRRTKSKENLLSQERTKKKTQEINWKGYVCEKEKKYLYKSLFVKEKQIYIDFILLNALLKV
jgi:hypothetical protein